MMKTARDWIIRQIWTLTNVVSAGRMAPHT